MNDTIDGDFFLYNWSPDKMKKVLETLLRRESEKDDGSVDEDCHLLWTKFNAKQHVSEVRSHKRFVLKTYHRFKQHLPNLDLDQVRRHDDSKLSFVEVIGYTDRFVWQRTNSKSWNMALRHHYDSNSHHPENYMVVDANGYPTQRDMSANDLEESIVDMLACQWERSFRGSETITDSELTVVSDAFLVRYTPGDRTRVKNILKTLSGSIQQTN